MLAQVFSDPVNLVLMALLAVSELLALMPNVKSNSFFQLVYNSLKKLLGKE